MNNIDVKFPWFLVILLIVVIFGVGFILGTV
jgi:hypothetical protein